MDMDGPSRETMGDISDVGYVVGDTPTPGLGPYQGLIESGLEDVEKMMSSLVPIVVVAGLGLIIWAIVDVARKPPGVLSPRAKAGWIAGLVLGGLLFFVGGVAVALVYLVAVRPRLTRFT